MAPRKTNAERALESAKQKLMIIMDNDAVSDSIKAQLEEVDALICKAELGLGHRNMASPMIEMMEEMEELEEQATGSVTMANGNSPSNGVTDAGSEAAKKWLLSTFTKHTEIQSTKAVVQFDRNHSASIGSSLKKERKRSTCAEFEARLARLTSTPHGKEFIARAKDFSFDIIAFSSLPVVCGKPITALATYLLQHGLGADVQSDMRLVLPGQHQHFEEMLYHYFEEVECRYLDPQYHSNKHGADVMMTVAWLCNTSFFQKGFSVLDQLACIIAGAVHDVGHPGRNNDFQVNTKSGLALRYNDKSVLESMHAALSFEIMQQRADCNWFSLVQAGQDVNSQKYLRKCIVTMVLATDMSNHSEHVKELKMFVQARETEELEKSIQNDKEKKLEIMCCLIHAADISNPVKSTQLMLKWTEKVIEEFWSQGDDELALGLPVSPLCERNQFNVPQGQLGFLKFVIEPFWQPLSQLITEVQEAVDNLNENKKFWEEMQAKKASFKDIFKSVK